jgi:hypothetical protein
MPTGLNHPGSFQDGTEVTSELNPGTNVTTPRTFGNPVDWSPSPAHFGNQVNWSPSPSHFGNIVDGSQSPFIEAISPTSGSPSGGTLVTIYGTGFKNGATVFFGLNAATSVTVVSANEITCDTPASTDVPPVSVIVKNTDGLSGLIGNAFTYKS